MEIGGDLGGEGPPLAPGRDVGDDDPAWEACSGDCEKEWRGAMLEMAPWFAGALPDNSGRSTRVGCGCAGGGGPTP